MNLCRSKSGFLIGSMFLQLAIYVLLTPVGIEAQTRLEGEYQPYRFTTPHGEGIYFGHAVFFEPYADRYLIVYDDQGDDLYFLDIESLVGRRIGREGDGPGEYRIAHGFTVREDTLIVQSGPRYLRFTLPDLEYIDMRILDFFVKGIHPVWEESGEFYTPELPIERYQEGLFAKYSATGELIEIYGEFDPLDKYDSPRMLQMVMNGGSLHRLPDGDLAFFYGYQPRVLFFTTTGEQIGEIELDMPWYGRGRINPFRSEQFGWGARCLIQSETLVKGGFLIASNGWDRRREKISAVLARYSWKGELLEIINLPLPEDREALEDRVNAATILNGRYFVLVFGDPAVREVIVKP